MKKVMEFLSCFGFGTASLVLMALSLALVGFAIAELYGAAASSWTEFGDALLGAVGYVIIAVAVFDVAKYFIEEEVTRGREMRIASEARRSLTKFISTISIAVFIEGLVTVVRVSKQDVDKMLYPTLLLLTAVVIVVGLGLYQRLSAVIEQQDEDGKKANLSLGASAAQKRDARDLVHQRT
jgi:Ni,Fe-hydrogenase I cytochrome b subunit